MIGSRLHAAGAAPVNVRSVMGAGPVPSAVNRFDQGFEHQQAITDRQDARVLAQQKYATERKDKAMEAMLKDPDNAEAIATTYGLPMSDNMRALFKNKALVARVVQGQALATGAKIDNPAAVAAYTQKYLETNDPNAAFEAVKGMTLSAKGHAVRVGDALVDNTTGEVLYEAPPKPTGGGGGGDIGKIRTTGLPHGLQWDASGRVVPIIGPNGQPIDPSSYGDGKPPAAWEDRNLPIDLQIRGRSLAGSDMTTPEQAAAYAKDVDAFHAAQRPQGVTPPPATPAPTAKPTAAPAKTVALPPPPPLPGEVGANGDFSSLW